MKRGKSRQNKNNKSRRAKVEPTDPKKRNTLTLIRNGSIAACALGGVGATTVFSVRATAAEHDLTRIGQGTPTVVQIHDPTCPLCTELQRKTRRAMRSLDGDVTYLVADIRTDEGSALAARYGVGHVTLLLFCGAGEHLGTYEGVRPKAELETIFAAHFRDG